MYVAEAVHSDSVAPMPPRPVLAVSLDLPHLDIEFMLEPARLPLGPTSQVSGRYRPPTWMTGRRSASGSASRRTSWVTGAVSPSPKSRKRNRYTIGLPSVQPK